MSHRSHQHHPTYLDNGRVLLLDNGSHRYGPDHPAVQGKMLDPERLGNFNRLHGGR